MALRLPPWFALGTVHGFVTIVQPPADARHPSTQGHSLVTAQLIVT